MTITLKKSHIWGYLFCAFGVILCVTYLYLGRDKVSAQYNTTQTSNYANIGSSNQCGPNNNIVGYNLAGLNCTGSATASEIVDWSIANGNWTMFLLSPECTLYGNGDVDAVQAVKKASDAGKSVILRLYGGGGLNEGAIPEWVSCLGRISAVSGNFYVEPHNEINMEREVSGSNRPQQMGQYLRKLLDGLKGTGVKVLFPSVNVYPNTADPNSIMQPKEFIRDMMSAGSLSYSEFSGLSVHVYGGIDNVTLFNEYADAGCSGDSCYKTVNCTKVSDCFDAVYGSSVAGTGLGGLPVFVTEMGMLICGNNGCPADYKDPATAGFLAEAWQVLRGRVHAAVPLIYDTDQLDCSTYFLPSDGDRSGTGASTHGMSSLVSVASYKGCSIDYEEIKSMTDRSQLLDYFMRELKIGLCDSGNQSADSVCDGIYKCITCGNSDLLACSSTWKCCNGFWSMGQGSCIWPEWGGIVGICEGIQTSGVKKCSDVLVKTGEKTGISVSGGETEARTVTVDCHCDFTFSVWPAILTAAPVVMPDGMVRDRMCVSSMVGEEGGTLNCVPGIDCVDRDAIPDCYSKTRVSVTAGDAKNPETEETNMVGDLQDTSTVAKLNDQWDGTMDVPGEPETEDNVTTESFESARTDYCYGEFNKKFVSGLPYCYVQNPTVSIEPWVEIREVLSSAIDKITRCKKTVTLDFKVKDIHEDIRDFYVSRSRLLYGIPGEAIPAEEAPEVMVPTKAEICGEVVDVQLFYPSVGGVVCGQYSVYDALGVPGDINHCDAAIETLDNIIY